jgi:hypothetical protein
MNDEQIEELTKLLKKPVFQQLSRLTTTPIIEVVPLRTKADNIEILLLEREADDPVWPGQLHTPGTGIRPTDSEGSFTDPINRVLAGELKGIKTSKPYFVTNILHHSGRGMEASQIYWVEVLEEPVVGTFYNVTHLPQQLVKSQSDFIPLAIKSYEDSSAVR